jgi:cyanophycinase
MLGRMKLLAALSLLGLLALAPLDPPPQEGGPRGHLVVVGGGGTIDPIRARAIELAGGARARVVVLPQASSTEERGEGSVEMWREDGLSDVVNVDGLQPERAVELVAAADLIWISGGSQRRFLEAWGDTPVPEAIRRAYERGAVIGGTSAGAAVMSPLTITGEADLEAIRAGATEVIEGLGLWPGTIVDQHFLARRRSNRLIAAVLDHPGLVGVGIDERTAVVVAPGGELEVVGEGAVMLVDAREAEIWDTEEGEPHAARGLRVNVLRDGMVATLAPDGGR